MATQYSSSQAPSTTVINTTLLHAAVASESTSSNTPTPTGNSGVFTANSSPPLIVAFLAIGLFMAATLAVFGWRRMYMSRNSMTVDLPRGGVRRRGDEFGETPELWDFWTREPTKNTEDMKWESIMPFSAIVKTPLTPPKNDKLVERSTLQVAVAIAMPSPPNTGEGEDERLEYSLGMMDMPWRSEAG